MWGECGGKVETAQVRRYSGKSNPVPKLLTFSGKEPSIFTINMLMNTEGVEQQVLKSVKFE